MRSVALDPVTPFDALGDPTRRAIVQLLAHQELPVGEIAAGFPISRPAVSKHLRKLEGAGLVTARAEGRRTFYSVNPDGLAGVREAVDRLWEAALPRFREVAERPEVNE